MTKVVAHLNHALLAVWSILLLFVGVLSLSGAEVEDYERKANELCQKVEAEWRKAGSPGEWSPAGEALVDAAIHADRPDLVDQVLTEGNPVKRMLPVPRGGRRVPLHILHTFRGVHAQLSDEMFASSRWRGGDHGWLARRITQNAVEVWSPKHGWLFDGHGGLRHEARPERNTGQGREWYGAFLPDGRWITTDLDEFDGTIQFYSASGKRVRALTCDELAVRPQDGGVKLIGWARSDRGGEGWVANIGSEDGWATVWVGPHGPARILKPEEKWALCYPRALGPRGSWLSLTVPDDSGRIRLEYDSASHGPYVGFPDYSSELIVRKDNIEPASLRIAGGSEVFGFWPGKTSFFIGAETDDKREPSGLRTRKFLDYIVDDPRPMIDKTWFFEPNGKLIGWLRARRVGDAADGRSMLFRVTADSQVLTMGPDMHVSAARRFTWHDGRTADAVVLWDDLRLGLFIRHHRLILAAWPRQS